MEQVWQYANGDIYIDADQANNMTSYSADTYAV